MKFPLTPKRAYFSMKKNLLGSTSTWASLLLEPFSEPEPSVDEKDEELASCELPGAYVVGEEFCELVPFCWFALPFPFALFD